MGKEIKTHRMKVLGRKIIIKTKAHPDMVLPQTTFSIEGTLRGHPVKEADMGGMFIGTNNGRFLKETSKNLKDRIENPQNWQARRSTS